jgi:hypothetical protein
MDCPVQGLSWPRALLAMVCLGCGLDWTRAGLVIGSDDHLLAWHSDGLAWRWSCLAMLCPGHWLTRPWSGLYREGLAINWPTRGRAWQFGGLAIGCLAVLAWPWRGLACPRACLAIGWPGHGLSVRWSGHGLAW